MKRVVSVLGGFSLLAAGSLAICTPSASAISGTQARCAFDQPVISAGGPDVPIPGLSVSVNNTGTSTRKAIVQLSADTCVPANSEVRVSYSVDGGAPQVLGPANFANNQEFCQTHTTIAVVSIPPGAHTVRPFWRLQGAGQASMISRCVTVELNTQ